MVLIKIKNFFKENKKILISLGIIGIIILMICYRQVLNSNSGAIQAVATVILVIITGYYVREVRKGNLMEHFKKLESEFSSWIPKLTSSIFDLRRLPEFKEEWEVLEKQCEQTFSSFIQQHLSSGYENIYRSYINWENEKRRYNQEIKEFVEKLVKEAKKKIKLPERNFPEESCYYQRLIVFTISSVFPSTRYEGLPLIQLKKEHYIQNGEEKTSDFFYLNWKDITLIKTVSHEHCQKGYELISELKNSEELKKEIENYSKRFQKLQEEAQEIAKEVSNKIIKQIQLGGTIKGKCSACS